MDFDKDYSELTIWEHIEQTHEDARKPLYLWLMKIQERVMQHGVKTTPLSKMLLENYDELQEKFRMVKEIDRGDNYFFTDEQKTSMNMETYFLITMLGRLQLPWKGKNTDKGKTAV